MHTVNKPPAGIDLDGSARERIGRVTSGEAAPTLFSDLYFYLISASWMRLLLMVIALFVIIKFNGITPSFPHEIDVALDGLLIDLQFFRQDWPAGIASLLNPFQNAKHPMQRIPVSWQNRVHNFFYPGTVDVSPPCYVCWQ